MPINRKLYTQTHGENYIPAWPCPSCKTGHLLIKPNALRRAETKASKDGHQYDEWDPEWIEYNYSATFICSHAGCKEEIFAVGTGGVAHNQSYHPDYGFDESFDDWFRPKYFTPHLKIFLCPENTPEVVQKSIDKSFEAFFSSPSSAANHIRIALENLMDELNVKRFKKVKNKYKTLTLHERLDLIPSQFNDIKDHLMAAKWSGNAGSHKNDIPAENVLDLYEILEDALQEIYTQHKKKIKKMVSQINKNKGPVKGKK